MGNEYGAEGIWRSVSAEGKDVVGEKMDECEEHWRGTAVCAVVRRWRISRPVR